MSACSPKKTVQSYHLPALMVTWDSQTQLELWKHLFFITCGYLSHVYHWLKHWFATQSFEPKRIVTRIWQVLTLFNVCMYLLGPQPHCFCISQKTSWGIRKPSFRFMAAAEIIGGGQVVPENGAWDWGRGRFKGFVLGLLYFGGLLNDLFLKMTWNSSQNNLTFSLRQVTKAIWVQY